MEDTQQTSVQQDNSENASLGTSAPNGADAESADGQTTETSALETLAGELKEAKSKYLYLYAEFENYKKRALKERSDYIKFGHESLMRELISLKDNLERALQFAGDSPIVAGLKMVDGEFRKTLERFGVQIHSALGQKFDPSLHEAIGQEPQESLEKVGLIVREEQKGYSLHGRLIRAARVIVGVGATPTSEKS